MLAVFGRFLGVFGAFLVFEAFFFAFSMFFHILFLFFLLPVRLSTEWYLFAVFLTVFRKVSRFWSFFRRFQSVFGVFICFLNVFSNFLLVFLVYCPIFYRRTPFFWFFNGFSKSQPFLVVFRRFQSKLKQLFFHNYLIIWQRLQELFPIEF